MTNNITSDFESTASPAQNALIAAAAESPRRTPPPGWSIERVDCLPYERRHGCSSTSYGLTMPGGYWVDEDLVRTAWRLFWRGVHGVDPARPHTAKSLCTVEAWAEYSRGDCLRLGRCFKYFAVNHVLPITLLNPDKKGTCKYRLDADLVSAPSVH